MFSAGPPVTAHRFYNRRTALRRLADVVERLAGGAPKWLAIIGPRKSGKTSLLLEAARRAARDGPRFVVLDVQSLEPSGVEFFRTLVAAVLDAAVGAQAGRSFRASLDDPAAFRAALQRPESLVRLAPEHRAWLGELPDRHLSHDVIRLCLEMPETVGSALGQRFVVAVDEFQELASARSGRRAVDLFPLMRSVWQQHVHVAYVVSGSARTMLTELVTSDRSPFFQHFDVLDLGPFDRADALDLLVRSSPPGREIPRPLAERAIDAVGPHPFYLQLLGDALTMREPPYDERDLKATLQDLLFSRTGRLSLFFEREYARTVGRATTLAAALRSVAAGPRRLSEVAADIGASAGSASHYLARLGDMVGRRDDGLYAMTDPACAAWVRWRGPGGSAVPMSIVGDEAERSVAQHVARLGFDLVYQSRGSRGAFDLLATRGPWQLGLQVKRTALPVRFSPEAWSRMEAEARRFGWRWAVAVLTPPPDERVVFLDPRGARTGRTVSLSATAEIENVLAWFDDRGNEGGAG